VVFFEYELAFIFFFIALLYSSVGFGGGSSYLAILALYGFDYKLLRFTALICNILVVSNGSFHYYKKGWLKIKSVLPFILSSIPFAFLGGSIRTSEKVFFISLGIVLSLAAILLWFRKRPLERSRENAKESIGINILIGVIAGFISGFLGIGGGIFLAPLLHFKNWGDSKKIAAASSFFILCNSISGISGQMTQLQFSQIDLSAIIPLLIAVFAGSMIGARLSTGMVSTTYIRKFTAILIFFVGIRLLYLNL
jgi:uncharacterized protein